LLIDAMASLLPPGLTERRKRGFILPFRQWLLRDLQERVGATFLSAQPHGPWEKRAFRRVWEDFRRGRIAGSRVLTLFVLEDWLQQNGVTC
jgi:asparagine synthase (glutamine-hydrolysing)